ncbi:unnamed protein product [Arabidopsis halleri]
MKFQRFKRNICMEVEGIDLIAEGKSKKTKKTAPKSDLKLLVKTMLCRKLRTHLLEI